MSNLTHLLNKWWDKYLFLIQAGNMWRLLKLNVICARIIMDIFTIVYYLIMVIIIKKNNRAFYWILCIEIAYQAFYKQKSIVLGRSYNLCWVPGNVDSLTERFSNLLKSMVIELEFELDLWNDHNQSFTHWWISSSRYY